MLTEETGSNGGGGPAILFTTLPTLTDMEINPDLCCERLVTNLLIRGMPWSDIVPIIWIVMSVMLQDYIISSLPEKFLR
jgi:hypothetical protein